MIETWRLDPWKGKQYFYSNLQLNYMTSSRTFDARKWFSLLVCKLLMSQAFDVPAFPVDTHIHRLMTRWKLTSGKNVVQTEKDAKRLFPKELWNKLHLQIIFYGREYCPSRGHKEEECPICSSVA